MRPVTSDSSRDVNENCNVTQSDLKLTNGDKAFESNSDEEEILSISSSTSEPEIMGAVEERASSSLSTSSSKGSKIPRLNRSKSLREKPHRNIDQPVSTRGFDNDVVTKVEKTIHPIGGLYRSSSFATTRGMKEFPSSIYGRSSTPATPELKRKFPNYHSTYVSPYSKKSIAAERKTQIHLSIPSPREKEVHAFFSPQVSRRISVPPLASHFSSVCTGDKAAKGETSPDDDDDDASEKSFGSVCSAQSCDFGSGVKRSGGGFWGFDRRSRNILHCTHAHDHDPDDYLTPTQRAARKIRELQTQLKNARREIMERDHKISTLTRDLVELRMNKAEFNEMSKSETPTKTKFKELEKDDLNSSPPRTSSPVAFIPCLTPTSDDSDKELKTLTRGKNKISKEKIAKDESQNPTSSSRHSPSAASIGGDSDSGELSRSLADSGHYDDLPSPCMSSRVSHEEDSLDCGIPSLRKIISSLCSNEGERDTAMIWATVCAAEECIKAEWSRKMEEMKSNHMEEYHELKERHNDKVEMLLSKLSDANLKYFELRPQYDKAQEKMRQLEKESDRLKDELRENEIRHQKVYLQMYLKGQQSAKLEEEEKFKSNEITSSHLKEDARRFENDLDLEGSAQSSMVFSLMKQLAQSENEIEKLRMSHNEESRSGRRSLYGSRREEIDPEITLQFLKSAIYYFLTDKENAQGHLRAIESILGYSSVERGKINKYFRI